VAADNHATLAEYGARLLAQTGISVSRPVLCVILKRLGLVRKMYVIVTTSSDRRRRLFEPCYLSGVVKLP
jgi:transposase